MSTESPEKILKRIADLFALKEANKTLQAVKEAFIHHFPEFEGMLKAARANLNTTHLN